MYAASAEGAADLVASALSDLGLRSALTLTENVLYRTRHGYYLDLLPREVKAAAYDESVHVTGVLLAEMRRLVQGSAYAFNCQDDKMNTFDQSAAFAALARTAGTKTTACKRRPRMAAIVSPRQHS